MSCSSTVDDAELADPRTSGRLGASILSAIGVRLTVRTRRESVPGGSDLTTATRSLVDPAVFDLREPSASAIDSAESRPEAGGLAEPLLVRR